MVTEKWLYQRIKVASRLINSIKNEIREFDEHKMFNVADELSELKIRLQGLKEQHIAHRKALNGCG